MNRSLDDGLAAWPGGGPRVGGDSGAGAMFTYTLPSFVVVRLCVEVANLKNASSTQTV